MGLDLIVEARAKVGHEAEWRQTLERAFADEELSDAEVARFSEISVPGYEQLGAPRVGQDAAADAWIIEARKATTAEEIAEVLKEFDGYYVLRLVTSDGVPPYSHGGAYDGVDETSFRGSFLTGCRDVLSKSQIEEAWSHKLPEQAVAYGRMLLAAAASASAHGPVAEKSRGPGLLSRLGFGRKAVETLAHDEQLKIVEAAGRWFIFWGERGHAIRAWA